MRKSLQSSEQNWEHCFPHAGMEESQSRHTSPRIGARKSPVKFSEPLLPKHPIAMPDSPSKAEVGHPSDTLFQLVANGSTRNAAMHKHSLRGTQSNSTLEELSGRVCGGNCKYPYCLEHMSTASETPSHLPHINSSMGVFVGKLCSSRADLFRNKAAQTRLQLAVPIPWTCRVPSMAWQGCLTWQRLLMLPKS